MSRTTSPTPRLPASESLVEFTANPAGGALRVDREKGVIYGVKIIGNVSKNGREYPQATLNRAKSLYEGKAVNIDHPAKPGEPRGLRDRFGSIRNVVEKADGLYGDLHYNPKHALAEQVAWEAENNPGNLGLSHNANGRVVRKGAKPVVEEITSVASVDLVADPATTNGLFEGIDQGKYAMELAEALEKVAALTTEVAAEKAKVTQLTEQVSKLTGEKATLQEQVDTAAKAKAVADHKAAVAKLLDDNKIAAHLRKPELVAMYESVDLTQAEAGIKALAESTKGSGVKAVSGTPTQNMQEQRHAEWKPLSLAEFKHCG